MVEKGLLPSYDISKKERGDYDQNVPVRVDTITNIVTNGQETFKVNSLRLPCMIVRTSESRSRSGTMESEHNDVAGRQLKE